MTDIVKDRIRKLLALGTSSNENEAASAMRKAAAMMLEHGISQDQLKEDPEPVVGSYIEVRHGWQHNVAQAVGALYGCVPVFTMEMTGFTFVGRPDIIEAAHQTFPWLVAQVEEQYRTHLPSGMSQSERGEFRRSFKTSCSVRILMRARDIAEDLSKHPPLGCNALVVVNHRKRLIDEATDMLTSQGAQQKQRSLSVRQTTGGLLGLLAGGNVKLQKEIE